MTVDTIVQELISKGARFEIMDNALKVMLSKENMTPDLASFIRDHKQEMIRHINARMNNGINRALEKEYYATSPAQKRLYFLHDIHKTSLAYNLPQTNKIEGFIDKERLLQVFRQLILRYEGLRTAFRLVNGDPVQVILPHVDFDIEYFQASASEAVSVIQQFVRPFDLSQGRLIRVGLVQLKPEEHILIVDIHHLVTDGISHVLLIKDFIQLYNGAGLPEVKLQYKDYAEWLQNTEQQKLKVKQKEFWLSRFSDKINGVDLPADFTRPAIKNYRGDKIQFSLSELQTAQLRAFSKSEGATLFMTILAAYNVFLSKLSDGEDIVIGTPVTGRSHPDLENIFGMFVNILPLRNFPEGKLSFRQFVASVKANTLACIDNQDFQYEELVDALKIERNAGSYPLIDLMFVHNAFERPETEFPGLTLSYYPYNNKISKFDLMLTSIESVDLVHFEFEFSTELFKPETIHRFIGYFKQLITALMEDTGGRLSEIRLQTDHQIAHQFNDLDDISIDYTKRGTIVEQFERQAMLHPNGMATCCNGHTTTYEELRTQMNKVVSYLQQVHAVTRGDLLGVMLQREAFMIPVILGILKAGAVYVPLDPSHPIERTNTIIRDAKLKLLITRGDYPGLPAGTSLINANSAEAELDGWQAQPTAVAISEHDRAYIIYTSGSTGNPKGVVIQHHSFINYICWASDSYLQQQKLSFAFFTSIAFDLTITSVFVPLVSGNTLHIYREDADDFPVDQVIRDNQSEIVKLTPSHLKLLKDSAIFNTKGYRSKIKRFIIGGEELTSRLAHDIYQLFDGNIELYNEYGPTEATVGCMIHRYDPATDTGRTVPIGKPAANTAIYLLDQYGNPVSDSVAGEIYISGAGIAEGYLNNAQLTQQRFPQNLFSKGQRMYKTGDLAKRLPGGNIEFIGRRDNQVKVNGYRIELGEIENQLLSHHDIKEAVVVAKTRDGHRYLVAYYVSEMEIDDAGLQQHLAPRLPDYMIPRHFIHLHTIPLTQNGKVAINALPEPSLQQANSTYTPVNETEERLIEIWSDILKIASNKIDINSNFFTLGGHSLRTYNLLHRIEKEFNVKVSLLSFFEKPTIKELQNNILVARLSQKTGSSHQKVTI